MVEVIDEPFAGLDVAGAPRTLVAFGATLDAPTLVAAYRCGLFPWPSSAQDQQSSDRAARRLVRSGQVPLLPGDDGMVPWCSPEPRALVLTDQVRVSRSLRARLRHSGWTATVDSAFDDVVAACADRTEGTWITDRMAQAYGELHRSGATDRGGAHSVEIWHGDALVGGLYGVLVGSVFCGESMFHRTRDASKVALVELCSRLRETGVRVVDVQEATEHLTSLGQVLIARTDYLQVLHALRDQPARMATDRRPVSRHVPA